MKVHLSKDEYNNNITPTYFLQKKEGIAIDGRTKFHFTEPNYGDLSIEGDAYDVQVILEDISLSKVERKSYKEDLADENDRKKIIEEINNRIEFKLDTNAVEFLATKSFKNRRQLIRLIYRLASHVYYDLQSNLLKKFSEPIITKKYLEELDSKNCLLQK